MDTLTGRAVPLEAVLGTAAAEIAERLYALASWRARFDLPDEILLVRLPGAAHSVRA